MNFAGWLKALDSEDAAERGEAIVALGEFGPEAAAAVPRLVGFLRTYENRTEAGIALGAIGAVALPAVEPLLDDSDSGTRVGALAAVGNIGAASRGLLPKIVACFQKGGEGEKDQAAVAIFQICSKHPAALEYLGQDGARELLAGCEEIPAGLIAEIVETFGIWDEQS